MFRNVFQQRGSSRGIRLVTALGMAVLVSLILFNVLAYGSLKCDNLVQISKVFATTK